MKKLLFMILLLTSSITADFTFQDDTNYNSLWVCQDLICEQLPDGNRTTMNITTVYESRGEKLEMNLYDMILNNALLVIGIISMFMLLFAVYLIFIKKK